MRSLPFLALIVAGTFGIPLKRIKRAADVDADDAMTFLSRFGYMTPELTYSGGSGGYGGQPIPENPERLLKKAILDFQTAMGLEATGELDAETKESMVRPRCGRSDFIDIDNFDSQSDEDGPLTTYGRSKWNNGTLKYYVDDSAQDLSREEVRKAIAAAASRWSAIIPLDFVEVPKVDDASLSIRFGVKEHGDGCDRCAFDGQGRILAHAYPPRDGRVHFDDDETWVIRDTDAIKYNEARDLVDVATHELGHAIGLEHAKGPQHLEDVMFPQWIPKFDSKGRFISRELSDNDIKAVQDIYGKRQLETGRKGRYSAASLPPPPPPASTSYNSLSSPPLPSSHPLNSQRAEPEDTKKNEEKEAKGKKEEKEEKPRCPDEDFFYFPKTNKCYVGFSPDGFKNWTLALGKEYCEKHYPDYSLPSVHSHEENEWLSNLFKAPMFLGYTSNNSLDFRTMDGSRMNFMNFKDDEPDMSSPDENCVIIYGTGSPEIQSQWSNLPCHIQFGFFCAGPPL